MTVMAESAWPGGGRAGAPGSGSPECRVGRPADRQPVPGPGPAPSVFCGPQRRPALPGRGQCSTWSSSYFSQKRLVKGRQVRYSTQGQLMG